VQRALAVDPDQRWPSVRAMAARAESLTRGHLASAAQLAVLVAASRDAGEGGRASASGAPNNSEGPSSVTSAPRSGHPDAERPRRDPAPPGQIAWEHPGGTGRVPRSLAVASRQARRPAKLVGAAVVLSLAIASVSGYLLLFQGTSERVSTPQGSVLVTRQASMPSAATLELLPPPVTSTGSAPLGSAAPRTATATPTHVPAAPPAPRPPVVARPTAPPPSSAATRPSTPQPAPGRKPKLDPKEVFGI
jgi:hypothetical protein